VDKRQFKDSVYNEIAGLTKALASPKRIEIVDLLGNGEMTVEQIAEETSLSFANASQHLQNLKRIKLVKTRKQKNYIYYSLGNQYVFAIWKALREFSRYHIPEIDLTLAEFNEQQKIKTISIKDLENYFPYTLLDIRPAKEYENKHLDGSINIPTIKLSTQSGILNRSHTIITYCRGPFCTMSGDAVAILREQGFKTLRLEEGAMDA